MPSQWYIYLGPEEEDGPYNSNAMRNHARLGNITPDTPIRRHDMRHWVKAKCLTNLFPDGKRMPSGYYQVPGERTPPAATPSGRMPSADRTRYREQNETISMSVAELAEKNLEHDPDLAAILGLEAWEEVLEPDPEEVADGRARVVDTETGIVAIDSGPPLPPEEEAGPGAR